MTGTTRPASVVHWNMLKHLSDDEKIDLILLLSQSLRHSSKPKETKASEFYGIWGDDGMSDDEFINELKSARTFGEDIVEL